MIVTDKTKTLKVENAAGETIFHAPVTVGSQNDPLPVGEWKVNGVSRIPTFNYNPDLFWDADPSHAKAKIPPGPNNPVGVVWIDLSKEHYGIHGTPEPSRIGYTRIARLHSPDQLGRFAAGGAGGAGHEGHPAMRRRRRRILRDDVLAPWVTVAVDPRIVVAGGQPADAARRVAMVYVRHGVGASGRPGTIAVAS